MAQGQSRTATAEDPTHNSMFCLQSAYAHASRIQALAEHQKTNSNGSSGNVRSEAHKASAPCVGRQGVNHCDKSTLTILRTRELRILLWQKKTVEVAASRVRPGGFKILSGAARHADADTMEYGGLDSTQYESTRTTK